MSWEMGTDIVTKHRGRLDWSAHEEEHPHPQLLWDLILLNFIPARAAGSQLTMAPFSK